MASDDRIGMIQTALNDFGLRGATVECLDSVVHVNARIVADSENYFLKILAGDCTKARLQSRQQFLGFLREGELAIPPSINTVAGRPFSSLSVPGEERLAVLYAWINGETLGNYTAANWIERCGTLLARFHARSQNHDPPDGFDVPSWDDVCAPEADGWLASLLSDSPLDQAAVDIVQEAAARTRTIATRLPKNRRNHGLIHADFHSDNLIFDGDRIWIVDCDDIGWGYFLFDVAWPAVLFAKHHPDEGVFLDSFLEGYEQIRPLTDAEQELLPEFLLGAGMGALEMIHSSPIANDSPVAQEWFTVIVEWLERQLSLVRDGTAS